MSHRPPLNGSPYRIALFAAFLLAGIAMLRIMLTAAIPAYQHDWTWPGDEREVRAALEDLTSGWSWFGEGHHPIYPFASYLYIELMQLAELLSPRFVLSAYIVSCLTLAGFGAFLLAKTVRIKSSYAAFGALLCYEFSPVIFSKISAGHTYYWLAYALLPYLIVIVGTPLRASWIQKMCALTLVLIYSWSQAQFIVFDLAICAFASFFSAGARKTWLLLAVVLALTADAYPFVTLLHPPTGDAFLRTQVASLAGIRSESVSFGSLLAQIGYPPSYYERLVGANPTWLYIEPIWQALFLVGSGGLAAGLVLSRMHREAIRIVIAAGILGAIIVSGANGPIGPLVAYLFVHVKAASILKELYHAMALVSIAVAVGTAISIDILLGIGRSLERSRLLGFATLLSCGVVSLPFLTGAFTYAFAMYEDADLGPMLARLSPAPHEEPARVLLEPNVEPIAPPDASNSGGVDFEALQPSAFEALTEPLPEPSLAWLESSVQLGRSRNLAGPLGIFGVTHVIVRKDLESRIATNAGLSSRAHSRWSNAALIDHLGQSNLIREDLGERYVGFRVPESRGIVRASAYALVVSNDRDVANQAANRLANGGNPGIEISAGDAYRFARGDLLERVPDADSLAMMFISPQYLVPFAQNAQGFDARRDWVPTEHSFFWNSWVSASMLPTLFTLGPSPLLVRLPASNTSGVLLLNAAAGSAQLRAISIGAGGAEPRLYQLKKIGNANPPAYELYEVIGRFDGSKDLSLSFLGTSDGVSVASIAFLPPRVLSRSIAAARLIRTALPESEPYVTVDRVGSTVFSIRANGARSRCAVALMTTFDSGWVATQVQSGTRPLPHFRAEGWANGWIVPCQGQALNISYDQHFYRTCLALGFLIQLAALLTIGARYLYARIKDSVARTPRPA